MNDEHRAEGPVDKDLKVLQEAQKPQAVKPKEVSDSEWRKARIDAGHMVVIRSHFKSIFLVPLAIISLICGISVSLAGAGLDESPNKVDFFFGLVWALSFMFYMNIFIFEWNRAWTVVLIGAIVSLICIGFAIDSDTLPVWQTLFSGIRDLRLGLSEQAYFFFAIFFGLCALVSYVKTRLNYVVVEHNEMQVYRNALFGDRERISMLNPRIEVKVTDMIEYFHPFYRAGTVVIHGPDRSILLDNVLDIRRIERATDRLGSTLRVSVEQPSG